MRIESLKHQLSKLEFELEIMNVNLMRMLSENKIEDIRSLLVKTLTNIDLLEQKIASIKLDIKRLGDKNDNK